MAVQREAADRRREVIDNMRAAIERNEANYFGAARVMNDSTGEKKGGNRAIISSTGETLGSSVEKPVEKSVENVVEGTERTAVQETSAVAHEVTMTDISDTRNVQKGNENSQKTPKDSIMELVNNSDFSVATIAKEANRIKRKDEGEVFISLH